jgi:glycosyltransferase involved in cell wall biosynthesis
MLSPKSSIVTQLTGTGTEYSGVIPKVSVVIPTRNRPALVVRAVKSALAQTLSELEVIVVIDGQDEETVQALHSVSDPRVCAVSLQQSVGGAEARNVGVRAGRGEFIAFLDDDDEWSADKLARQLDVARSSAAEFPVVTCRLTARRPNGDEHWPARKLNPGESMSEYLLCREASIRQGEGFIQTSTLLIPRRLLNLVPFTPGLPRHQDWDWLIRVSEHAGVEFSWVWEPLVIYHIGAASNSVSAGEQLEASVSWVSGCGLVTPKAKAYFYATQVAVRCKTLSTFCSVVRHTARFPRALVIAIGLAFIPRNLVYSLRRRSLFNHA